MTVESTDTVQSMSSSASADVRIAAKIFSHVPSTPNLISRLWAV
jgi:hypothetical protein